MNAEDVVGRWLVADVVFPILLAEIARAQPNGDAWLRERFIAIRNLIAQAFEQLGGDPPADACARAAFETLDKIFDRARKVLSGES